MSESGTEIDPRDAGPTWWTKWRVPAAPVITGMAVLTFAVGWSLWGIDDARGDLIKALEAQECDTKQEFRGWFTEYLRSQVGSPVEEVPGFDQLPPDVRLIVSALAPIVEADRLDDLDALERYMEEFPIPACP